MDEWTKEVLEKSKTSLKKEIDRYTTWIKLIRRIDRTRNAHEELLGHVTVEMSYFHIAEEMTAKEIINQHILTVEQLPQVKIGTAVNTSK